MTVVRRIGFAYNPTKEDAVDLSARAAGWCTAHGIESWALAAGDHAALVEALAGPRCSSCSAATARSSGPPLPSPRSTSRSWA